MIFFRSKLIHLCLILGLITSTISPACQFISGNASFIEICTAWGSKTLKTPTFDEDVELTSYCEFCFSNAVHKVVFVSDPAFQADLFVTAFIVAGAYKQVFSTFLDISFEARAPPVIS